MAKDVYDSEKIYCRKLGHYLTFGYCRVENFELPCSKVLDCWFDKFPISEFLNASYSEEEKQKIFAPPKEKIATIFDIIDRSLKQIKGK